MTPSGGRCRFCLITVLFITELKYFLQLETKDQMVIDMDQDRKYLDIGVNITFWSVPCSVLQMNLIDSKKANVLHATHEIYKTRLARQKSPGGREEVPVGLRIRDSLTNVAQTSEEVDKAGPKTERIEHSTGHLRCNSCFNSNIDEDSCCDSCEDVRNAFRAKRWDDHPKGSVFGQCVHEAYREAPPQEGEGCHIDAKLHVRKVAATIHVGVGKFIEAEHVHTADVSEFLSSLDFSHEVRHIAFGEDFPGLVHVLDGRSKSAHVHPNSEHFQYDMHVIPTRYQEGTDDEINSHQYSVTEYVKSINQRQRNGELVAVGLWANYDFTPFEVKVTRSRKPVLHFFTECCAILGGIFAFTGMLDNFSYSLQKSIGRRKMGSPAEGLEE